MVWFLVPILAAVVVAGVFWDEIREWYTDKVEAWLDKLGLLGDAFKRGFVEIDRVMVRGRRIVKRAVAYFRQARKYTRRTVEEDVDWDDIPDDVRESVRKGEKVVLEMKEAT